MLITGPDRASNQKSGKTEGSDPNTALDKVTTPGFWLLKLAIATALVLPRLYWKCMSPLGNKNTSPACRIFVYSLFSSFGFVGLDDMKPAYNVPSSTSKISEACGCTCGGFVPPGPKSMRTMEIPSVLSPGSSSTKTRVTLDPNGLAMFPGLLRPEKKKSSEVTVFGSLQIFPFTYTARVESNPDLKKSAMLQHRDEVMDC
ncbi:adenine deaminase 1 [Striga asiatica]|uniref:Adenine deaminase 1 n=1 Tax=Striga asiatica TaxID=4170 RepID=A0A5A7QWG0_STRAF|nr:adenine deaminase 1 [Striga asiatica]